MDFPTRVAQFRPPNLVPRTIVLLALAVVAIVFILTMGFTVEPEETGLVLRFGRFTRQVPSGLHVKLPWPVETVVKVPVERQLKEEFGFRTAEISSGKATTYDPAEYADESLMLTGDLNVAVVEWTAQFRVRDPYKFLFKVREVRKTFRDMNETVMREVVGDRGVNEVLTVGRQEIAAEVERRLQALCDQYETGIKVEQIVLQNVNPPDAVKPSFNEVNQAQQEREKLINQARADYNQVIPRAKGRAQQTNEHPLGDVKVGLAGAGSDATQAHEVFLHGNVLAINGRNPGICHPRWIAEDQDTPDLRFQYCFPIAGEEVLANDRRLRVRVCGAEHGGGIGHIFGIDFPTA